MDEFGAALESDDMFQSDHYCGGFDADEMAFCFSRFDETGGELWFQFDLDDLKDALSGKLRVFDARPADR